MMYRFDQTAVWHKNIYSSDNEQVRGGVKGVKFRCFSKNLSKGQISNLQGTVSKTISLILQTDDKIALEIEADDVVEYNNFEYSVASIESVRSVAYYGAKEYLIMLR